MPPEPKFFTPEPPCLLIAIPQRRTLRPTEEKELSWVIMGKYPASLPFAPNPGPPPPRVAHLQCPLRTCPAPAGSDLPLQGGGRTHSGQRCGCRQSPPAPLAAPRYLGVGTGRRNPQTRMPEECPSGSLDPAGNLPWRVSWCRFSFPSQNSDS